MTRHILLFSGTFLLLFNACNNPVSTTTRERFEDSYTLRSLKDMAKADSVIAETISEKATLLDTKERLHTEVSIYNPKVLQLENVDRDLAASGLVMMLYNNYEFEKRDTTEKIIIRFIQDGKAQETYYTVGEVRDAKALMQKASTCYDQALNGHMAYLLQNIDTTLVSKDSCQAALEKMRTASLYNGPGKFVIGGFKAVSLPVNAPHPTPRIYVESSIAYGNTPVFLVAWLFDAKGEHALQAVHVEDAIRRPF